MELKPGSTIRGLRILRLLGSGGMGTVYLAQDLVLEREVALKCLNPQLTQDPEFSDRFIREARIQAKLSHQNIVGLHSFFEDSGQFFMVLEYAPGVTLRQLIDRSGRLDEERALHIFNQIGFALAYAHAKGIIHRDIKPSNIMVDESDGDRVQVMDFGIARIMGDVHSTRTGTRLGTLSYMSPEQVQASKDVDQRTDIYSLGVVLFEMLSGKQPFVADTDSDYAILHQIVTAPLPDPRKLDPQISGHTIQLLNWMTSKNKEARPNSIHDQITSREIVADKTRGQTESARPTLVTQPALSQAVKHPRKNRQMSLSAAFFAMVLLSFFLPFTLVNCGNTRIYSFSGIQLVTGGEITLPDEANHEDPIYGSNLMAILSLMMAIGGFVSTLMIGSKKFVLPLLLAIFGIVLLLLLPSTLFDAWINNDSELRRQIHIKMQFGYFIALAGFLLAAIFSKYDPGSKKKF